MAKIDFERGTLPDGRYAIHHPERLDRLEQEIILVMPGRLLRLECHGSECSATFDSDLTPAELATFEQTVSDHKDNVQV